MHSAKEGPRAYRSLIFLLLCSLLGSFSLFISVGPWGWGGFGGFGFGFPAFGFVFGWPYGGFGWGGFGYPGGRFGWW